jgi:hypothetical protein
MLEAAFRGRNCCVLAHGATSSGKTHTLFGPQRKHVGGDASRDASEDGLVYRCIDYVLEKLSRASSEDATVSATTDVPTRPIKRVSMSVFEIYNDEVRDLLVSKTARAAFTSKAVGVIGAKYQTGIAKATKPPAIKSDDVGSLTQLDVHDRLSFETALFEALSLRASASTASNDTSSRSHCIIRLVLRDRDEADAPGKPSKPVSVIHLCDLAGAERIRESRVSGTMLTEACHVNASLTALSDCVSALLRSSNHVPYRNSTLTRILEPTMAPPARVLMVANVSGLGQHRDQALATLKYVAQYLPSEHACGINTAIVQIRFKSWRHHCCATFSERR